MATHLSDPAASAAAAAVTTLIDAGSSAGTLVIYSGTEPTSASTALSGNTVLATLTLSKPAFTAGSAGVQNAATITSATASATGTASFFRFLDSNSNAVIQGTIGTSGADLNLGSTAISTGATVSVSSFSYTQPE